LRHGVPERRTQKMTLHVGIDGRREVSGHRHRYPARGWERTATISSVLRIACAKVGPLRSWAACIISWLKAAVASFDQGDLAAELHREPAGRRDAGVRQNQQKIAALEAASPHAAQSTVAEECVPAGRGGLGRSNYRLIITASGRPGGL